MIAQALIAGQISWEQSVWQTSQPSEQEEEACGGCYFNCYGHPKMRAGDGMSLIHTNCIIFAKKKNNTDIHVRSK